MAWELNGANNLTNTRGVVGGFSWSRRNDGECLAFEVEARGDMLGIPPRGVVDFRVNGVRQFYGVAVEIPNPLSKTFGRLRAVGASELLGRTLLDTKRYDGWDVGAIARDVLTRLKHPLILGVSAPDVGATLKTFYMPYMPLSAVLDTLAKACPPVAGKSVTFGVDADGVAFFRYPAAAPALPEAVPAVEPVIVGDVVSKATLVIGLAPQGGAPAEVYESVAPSTPPPTPRLPYVFTVSAQRDHATYNSEKAFLPPKGVRAVKAKPGGVTWHQDPAQVIGTPYAATDGDPATYVASSGAVPAPGVGGYFARGVVTDPAPVVGFRLVYSLRAPIYTGYPNATKPPHRLQVTLMQFGAAWDGNGAQGYYPARQAGWYFPETPSNGAEKSEVMVIWPPEAWLVGADGYPDTELFAIFQESLDYQPSGPPVVHPEALKIYALEPVYANLEELAPVAEAQLRLPGASPRTLKVNGLVAPSMAGETFDYVHNEDVLSQTTISVGQRGGASGVAQAVKTVADKAAEPARQELLGQVIQG